MIGGDLCHRAILLEYVYQTPVRELRNHQARYPLQRRLVVERGRERRSSRGEQGEPAPRPHGLYTRELLPGKQQIPLLLGTLALGYVKDRPDKPAGLACLVEIGLPP